jgi:predicted HAD superfamily Cof-like phosphohydrolase
MYSKVLEFRTKLGLPVSHQPQLLEPIDISFHARFLLEELSELMKAHEQESLVDAADAVVDLIYVAMGCAHHMGLPLEELFDIVHNANMAKVAGRTKRGVHVHDAAKPDDWVSPEEAIGVMLKELSRDL